MILFITVATDFPWEKVGSTCQINIYIIVPNMFIKYALPYVLKYLFFYKSVKHGL
jgi:hypothetical protein